MASVEELLAPCSEEAPAGVDLGYDQERQVISLPFERPASVDPSGNVVTPPDVDWRETIRLIEDQSTRTKDIWLPIYLTRAGALSGKLETVETGALYLAGQLETYWDTMWPSLEEDEFVGRKMPCESLAQPGSFLIPLERTPLLEHPRLGRFSGVDFERFRSGAENEEGYGLFRAALNETPQEALQIVLARIASITDALARADKALMEHAGDDTGVNFGPAFDVLKRMSRAVQSFTATPAVEEASDEPESAGAAGGASEGGGGPRIAGRVETREDVIKAIDAIADYYKRREPASPVLAGVQRVREWVNLDFLSLLEDIAPGSLDEAKRVLMTQRKPSNDASSKSSW